MDAKLKAIVSHITIIGWIIAVIVNSGKKEELASYYIRQTLGLYLTWFVLSIIGVIPILGWVICGVGSVIVFIFWLMSLIWSINGEMKSVPWFGNSFQAWFKTL